MLSTTNVILLAEDNEDDVFIFKKALKAAQVANPVHLVSNGEEAVAFLTAAREQSEPEKHPVPRILFLDLKMPYLDGFQVLEWIRQQPGLQSMVVVVLSSSELTSDFRRAYALGARSYLVKPPKPNEIRELMVSLESLWGAGGSPLRSGQAPS